MNSLLSPAAALGAAATLGVADFSGGLAGRRSSPPSVAVGIELCGLIVLPFALLLLPLRWDIQSAALTFTGGAVGGFGLILFYRAMTLNLISIVAPITAVVAAALPTVVGLLSGDRLHIRQFAGIGVGLVAIAMINGGSREAAKGARAALGLALIAGVCFGLFFILFHAGSSAGVVAFLSGRAGSALTSVCFALFTGVAIVPRRSAWRLIGLGGACDGAGVVLYLYATFHGLLSLSALLTSFYPAFTILCARLFTRERLSSVQVVGAMLAVVAVGLIAAT
ncbi:MAG TPA: DMT family transporter [Candidatus Dormibacteraeota bacterium]|nr:DMT family transporter [Candidatus Dormibacteraeota bacterium]